jgi:hypothetical protein
MTAYRRLDVSHVPVADTRLDMPRYRPTNETNPVSFHTYIDQLGWFFARRSGLVKFVLFIVVTAPVGFLVGWVSDLHNNTGTMDEGAIAIFIGLTLGVYCSYIMDGTRRYSDTNRKMRILDNELALAAKNNEQITGKHAKRTTAFSEDDHRRLTKAIRLMVCNTPPWNVPFILPNIKRQMRLHYNARHPDEIETFPLLPPRAEESLVEVCGAARDPVCTRTVGSMVIIYASICMWIAPFLLGRTLGVHSFMFWALAVFVAVIITFFTHSISIYYLPFAHEKNLIFHNIIGFSAATDADTAAHHDPDGELIPKADSGLPF